MPEKSLSRPLDVATAALVVMLSAFPTVAMAQTREAATPQLAQRIDRGGVTTAPRGGASVAPTPRPTQLIMESGPAEVGPSMNLTVGKSTLLRLPSAIDRISVGNPAIADVTLINPSELYLLGKTFGSTNVILWRRGGTTTIIDIAVGIDTAALRQQLAVLLPQEKGIVVESAGDSIVMSGVVSSVGKADQAMLVAEGFVRTYARGITLPISAGNPTAAQGQQLSVGLAASQQGANAPRVINLMKIAEPQQVMLEVKVAEVSKNLLDKLGVNFNLSDNVGNWTLGIASGLLSDSASALFGSRGPAKNWTADLERRDGLVRILAEPNIVAISGQEGSFLAGGKIFIPVARANNQGFATITLEEKEFGVGLKFTPTVLDGGRINLKVSPEVSELSQTGSPFTTVGGVTAVLPSFTTRRAQTTVQLFDGQSLAIAGLIKNNITEAVRRVPVLGEVPILGALFRSSEFQTDRSELLFIITPRLVKPLPPDYALPTDGFVPPDRVELFGGGQLEGRGHPDVPADGPTAPPATMPPGGTQSGQGGAAGFQMK